MDSYNFKAADFLLKPIQFERFLKAAVRVNEILREKTKHPDSHKTHVKTGQVKPTEEYIFIKPGTELRKIGIGDIQYIEATGNYAKFYTSTGTILSLPSMKEAMEKLPAPRVLSPT